jgi:hypothetical protein
MGKLDASFTALHELVWKLEGECLDQCLNLVEYEIDTKG